MKKKKLTPEQRKLRQAERVRKRTEKKSQQRSKDLREMARKACTSSNQKLDNEQVKVQEISAAYEEAYQKYTGKTFHLLKKVPPKDTNSFKSLLRAAKFAEELGISCELYVTALFYWSDKWGKRALKLSELSDFKTKFPAKDRVLQYLSTVKGKARNEMPVSSYRPAPIASDAIRFAQSERQLKVLMRNYGLTAEDVLRKFGSGSNAFLYFDKDWLLSNQTYLRLMKNGEI